MKIALAYGKSKIDIDLPEKNLAGILRMTEKPAVDNPSGQTLEKLRAPIGSDSLYDMAKGKNSACIVVSDITRPVPNKIILPPIISELERAGIKSENITILNGTGIHRPNEGEELIALLGPDIPKKYRIVNHFGRDTASHEYLGQTPVFDAPIYVDKEYLKAEFKIATGLIEPHLMAGFSGGRKAIMPGICSIETVEVLHGYNPMAHEQAVEGIIESNPVHSDILYVAKKAGVDFIVNVTLNEQRQITGIFAGDLEKAHAEGVRFMRTQCQSNLPTPVDAVITSSAGYPLDMTFYQTIKGMTAAMGILKDGGVILIASSCSEGVGSPEFTKLMLGTDTMENFISKIKSSSEVIIDQWMFQKLCIVREKHEVWMYSGGINADTQKKLFVRPVESMDEGIKGIFEKYGENARIAVIPEGPYVLAKVGEC